MFVLQSYPWAVVFCVVTMFCWGSWANTQKLARKGWRFELFYWDYVIGVLLLSLILGLTLGSHGAAGRPFLADLAQASHSSRHSALLGGAIFNLANILLVAAIDIAGMSVAFPVGIGIALVLGVILNYVADPIGNAPLLFGGVLLVVLAIILDAVAYRKLPGGAAGVSTKGLVLSVACGLSMGFFYRFVAASMYPDFTRPEAGKLGRFGDAPYRRSRRDYLGRRDVVQHYRVGTSGICDFVWAGAGRDDGCGILGRVHLERIPDRAVRHVEGG